MLAGYAVIGFALAVIVGLTLVMRPRGSLRRGAGNGMTNLRTMMPILPFALLAASFIAALIPPEAAAGWIGPDAGFTGILIASAAGGITPGGPFISFPLALAFVKAGAGVPQTIAFISGWSVIAFHRMFIFEMPLTGLGFSVLRLLSCLILPPLSGATAMLIHAIFPL